MFCPNCGKDCKNDSYCSVCEMELEVLALSMNQAISYPPVGQYKASDGYLDISFYTLTINKQIFSQTIEHVIAYRDIEDIALKLASNVENGYLAILERGDVIPLATMELDAICNETALVFDVSQNSIFYEIYMFLDQYITLNQKQSSKYKDKKKYCPQCGSRHIRFRRMHVPVTVCMMNKYDCLSCGYHWSI